MADNKKVKQPRVWMLPALEGDKPLEVTTKIPGLKLVRDVRKLGYEATKIEGKKNTIAHELSKLEVDGYELAKRSIDPNTSEEDLKEIGEQIKALEKKQDEKYQEIEKVSAEVDANVIEQVKLIANVKDGDADQIDFDAADRSALLEIIGFFVDRSNGTKPAQ